MKADHAAKQKLQEEEGEEEASRDRENKREEKSWLVMFEVSIISDISLSAKRQQEALHWI